MTNRVDWNKPIQTICGYPARVLCLDLKDKEDVYSVVVAVDRGNDELVISCTREGKYFPSGVEHNLNIVNRPKKFTRWLNIYPMGAEDYSTGDLYRSEESAKRQANSGCIATVKVEFEA